VWPLFRLHLQCAHSWGAFSPRVRAQERTDGGRTHRSAPTETTRPLRNRSRRGRRSLDAAIDLAGRDLAELAGGLGVRLLVSGRAAARCMRSTSHSVPTTRAPSFFAAWASGRSSVTTFVSRAPSSPEGILDLLVRVACRIAEDHLDPAEMLEPREVGPASPPSNTTVMSSSAVVRRPRAARAGRFASAPVPAPASAAAGGSRRRGRCSRR